MSKSDKEFTIDAIGTIVGFVLFILISVAMVFWSDSREEYYKNNPNATPGSSNYDYFLFGGLIVLIPLIIFAGMLVARGLFVLFDQLVARYAASSQSTN